MKSNSELIYELILKYPDKGNGELADILMKEYPREYGSWKRKSVRDAVLKERKKFKNGESRDFNKSSESADSKNTENHKYTEGGDRYEYSKRYSGEQIKTDKQLIEMLGIDTTIWKVDRWECNKWEVASKYRDQDLKWEIGDAVDDEGKPIGKQQLMSGHAIRKNEFIRQELWQVKVVMVRNKEKIETTNLKEELLSEIKKHSIVYPKIKYKQINKDKALFQVNIFDLHFGKHSWEDETGENFDIHIAKDIYLNCVSQLLSYANPYGIEKILLPVGNDFFNVDSRLNVTSNGTPQSEDTRWQKTFKRGRQLIISAVDMLTQIAPVDIIVIPGNHDFERTFYLGDALECWYHNHPNVSVDNRPTSRKYYQYGKNLIGFTHGKDEKIDDLPLLMASEVPQMWSETKYREWHLGHVHHQKVMKWLSTKEFKGTTVRFMRSLTPNDAWHFQKGFVGQIRAGEGFVWGIDNGIISQFSANL